MVYGDNQEHYIRGTLPKEVTLYMAELQAIKAALFMIERLNNQKWTIFFRFPSFNVGSCTEEHKTFTGEINPNHCNKTTIYHHPIRKHILKMWQNRWNQSCEKFRMVKPWVNIPGGKRKNEVKLTRLRIRHSRLTHDYYMSRGRPPECNHYRVPLTINHILIDCQATQFLITQLNLPNNLQNYWVRKVQ